MSFSTSIDYIHKTHPRSRSIRIKVEASGQVVVVTPKRVSQAQIEHFVQQSEPWIQRVLQKQQAQPAMNTTDALFIFGKKYQKEYMISATQIPKITVHAHPSLEYSGTLILTSTTADSAKQQTQLTRFLKNTAEKYISPRTHQLAQSMNTHFSKIVFRAQKTRWGSCSSTGTLSFNWRLVHFEPAIIDYVIIHELAHRTHMNHSQQFWKLVEKYDPEYRQHRGWLKRHGFSVG